MSTPMKLIKIMQDSIDILENLLNLIIKANIS